MREHIHFAPGFDSIAAVNAAYTVYDASTLAKVATCPRYHEVRVEENLEPADRGSPELVAGLALHLGLEFYYSTPRRDDAVERMAIEIAKDEWKRWELDSTKFPKGRAHFNADFMGVVLRSYFTYWGRQAVEVFSPLAGLKLSDLCLDKVLAARFRLNHQDEILLGESNIIMLYDVGGEPLALAGKPDLPVQKQDGRVYVMDHKTTTGYLSDWWAEQHEMSNKDRGYMAMMRDLLQREVHGTVINGIHLGEPAYKNVDSKAAKFGRYSFDFSPEHIDEALANQLAWHKTIVHYRQQGYFPQGCGYGGCKMPDLCRRDPATRAEVKLTDYQQSTRTFWDL